MGWRDDYFGEMTADKSRDLTGSNGVSIYKRYCLRCYRTGGQVKGECSIVEIGRVSALFHNHSVFAGARGTHTEHTRREATLQSAGLLSLIFAPTSGRDSRLPMH